MSLEKATGSQTQALVWNHMLGVVNSLALKCAVNLDIIDFLGRSQGPVSLRELAASLPVKCTNTSILRRVMHYLGHMGIVAIEQSSGGDDDERYVLTSASRFLMKDEPMSLAPFTLFFLNEDYLGAMHCMEACLTGDPTVSGYQKVKGESVWAHASRHPAHNQLFNRAMTGRAEMAAAGMIQARPELFAGLQSLVDVGGGTGTAARAVVREFPGLKCIVLDLPHVVRGLPQEPRIEYLGGDMFDSVPCADAVLLMGTLHDWDDEHCLKILRRCREAVGKEGKVIIVDAVTGDGDGGEGDKLSHARMACDMIMMVYTGGKERTVGEWKGLLLRAGLTLCKITPTMTLEHVIEARP